MEAAKDPQAVVLFCGKRKSGKDHVVEQLVQVLGAERSCVLRLSGPLKKQYAQEHGLDYERLLDSSSYKERYRQDMIRWGETIRDSNPAHFCSLACLEADRPLWLVSDCRRPSDMTYFTMRYKCVVVRVCAGENVRRERGWSFTHGVDDVPSECALDDFPCHVTIQNDGQSAALADDLQSLKLKILDL